MILLKLNQVNFCKKLITTMSKFTESQLIFFNHEISDNFLNINLEIQFKIL